MNTFSSIMTNFSKYGKGGYRPPRNPNMLSGSKLMKELAKVIVDNDLDKKYKVPSLSDKEDIYYLSRSIGDSYNYGRPDYVKEAVKILEASGKYLDFPYKPYTNNESRLNKYYEKCDALAETLVNAIYDYRAAKSGKVVKAPPKLQKLFNEYINSLRSSWYSNPVIPNSLKIAVDKLTHMFDEKSDFPPSNYRYSSNLQHSRKTALYNEIMEFKDNSKFDLAWGSVVQKFADSHKNNEITIEGANNWIKGHLIMDWEDYQNLDVNIQDEFRPVDITLNGKNYDNLASGERTGYQNETQTISSEQERARDAFYKVLDNMIKGKTPEAMYKILKDLCGTRVEMTEKYVDSRHSDVVSSSFFTYYDYDVTVKISGRTETVRVTSTSHYSGGW